MAPLTCNEHRRSVVSERKRHRFRDWAFVILASPALLVMLLGDILAVPFDARRNQSLGHWLLYMVARFLGPPVLIGLCRGYLIRRFS